MSLTVVVVKCPSSYPASSLRINVAVVFLETFFVVMTVFSISYIWVLKVLVVVSGFGEKCLAAETRVNDGNN